VICRRGRRIVDKKTLLIKLVKFGGWFEMGLAVMFLFTGYITDYLLLPGGLPLFYQLAAVELMILGFLLVYSARDIDRYLVIILGSCVLRFAMALGPEPYAVVTLWPNLLAVCLIPAMAYDIVSATLILFLLFKLGYLRNRP
jgi:hypothetical protein